MHSVCQAHSLCGAARPPEQWEFWNSEISVWINLCFEFSSVQTLDYGNGTNRHDRELKLVDRTFSSSAYMADVTDVHDAFWHATDSTIPDAVWSPTPNERPETVTEAPPEIGEFSAVTLLIVAY